MTQENLAQYSFLESFVLEALRAKGFDKLAPADQDAFLPQFMAEAERRLGLALMPYIKTKEIADAFGKLLEQDATPDDWSAFWNTHVPDFPAVVKDTLDNFAEELSKAFAL